MNAKLILEKMRDPAFEPECHPNQVMIVGTGGVRIWERLWSRKLHPQAQYPHIQKLPEEQQNTMRAMRMATSLARESQVDLMHHRLQFFDLTRTAIEMRHRFPKEMEKAGRKGPQGNQLPESGANRFARKYPDWHRRTQELEDIATDTLEMGLHLAFISIIAEDSTGLQYALQKIKAAPIWFSRNVRELDPGPGRPRPPQWDLDFPPQYMAATRLTYVRKIAGCESLPAREAVASAVIARDLFQIDRTNLKLLWNVERSYARSALRCLNDEVFREDQEGLRRKAVDALTNAAPGHATQAMSDVREIASWIIHTAPLDGEAVETTVARRLQEPINPQSIEEIKIELPPGPVQRALSGSYYRHMEAAFRATHLKQKPTTIMELEQAISMEELLRAIRRPVR